MCKNLIVFFVLTLLTLKLQAYRHFEMRSRNKTGEPVILLPVNLENRFGYIDEKGKMVIKPEFIKAGDFHEGMACIRNSDGFGFIDRKGKMILDSLKYDEVSCFFHGRALVKKNGKYGYIDIEGNEIIRPVYLFARDFTCETAAVSDGKKWGYIDVIGNIVIPFRYDCAYSFSENTARVLLQKFGFINRSGEYVASPQFDEASDFHEQKAAFRRNDRYGYIDLSGNEVITAVFHWAGPFSEGLAPVSVHGKFGFIDHSGNMVIKPQFEDARCGFSQGLSPVKQNGSTGFIDRSGKFFIEPYYEKAEEFHDGFARVWYGKKSGYISRKGKVISRIPGFSRFGYYSEFYHQERKKGEW